MTDAADTSRFLPLHPEAFRILVVLEAGEARHGYALVKELERDPGRPGRVLPANLYRRIRTLLEQGLIAESEENRPDHEDERRRYFTITSLGTRVARDEARRLRGLLAGAGHLLEPAEQ